jgi:hypothetical protein
MRRSILGLVFLALVATGGAALWAGGKSCGPHGASKQASAAGATSSSASCVGGTLAGRFDPAMSGVCRFACATRLKYEATDVLPQPGAKAGRLTQCPVSGVVFAVAADRPQVRVGRESYVTCCDKCATKLRRDPRRYLKV